MKCWGDLVVKFFICSRFHAFVALTAMRVLNLGTVAYTTRSSQKSLLGALIRVYRRFRDRFGTTSKTLSCVELKLVSIFGVDKG